MCPGIPPSSQQSQTSAPYIDELFVLSLGPKSEDDGAIEFAVGGASVTRSGRVAALHEERDLRLQRGFGVRGKAVASWHVQEVEPWAPRLQFRSIASHLQREALLTNRGVPLCVQGLVVERGRDLTH